LVVGSSRYATGEPSRKTTPRRFGFGSTTTGGGGAGGVTGASLRVGLKRFRLAMGA
jgi:hypothetical protein